MSSSRRASIGALAALLAIAVVVPFGMLRASGAEQTPISVTIDPATGLEDGQDVQITVRTSVDFPVYSVQAQQCRDGVDYQPSDDLPNKDAKPGGANCPSAPVTSSADLTLAEDDTTKDALTPAGFVLHYRVGSGVVTWGPQGGAQQSLTCDPDHKCALVVEVYGGPGPRWYPFATTLDFGSVDPISGCGGPADGIVSTAASDRFSDAWVNWTIDQCLKTPDVGARSRAVFAGEGEGVASFTAGIADLAYTGLGYRDDAGFAPNVDNRRAAVNVPVSLNAVVLAVAGGPAGKRQPYTDLRLTTDELAILVSGGQTAISALKPDPSSPKTYQQEVETNNPELDHGGGMFDANQTLKVGASSERSIVAYLMSRFLTSLDPVKFKVPDFQPFAPDQGKDRVVSPSFATALPSYAAALELFSGRPVFKKTLASLSRSSSGGLWVVTDLATARALHLTVVKIQNKDGKVVEPTDEAMRAAVAKMQPDANGLLDPDPKMVASGTDVAPYPLTYVEYAMAPAEPLVTPATCILRTASQDNLDVWLKYITGLGQPKLPAGMLPLDGAMSDQAASAIAKVGKSTVTGKCEGKVTGGPTTTTTVPATTTTAPGATTTTVASSSNGGSSGGSSSSGSGSSSSRRSSSSSSRSSSSGSATPIVTIATAQQELAAGDDAPKVPKFSGARGITASRALLALLGIVIITSGITIVTAGSGDDPRRRPGAPPPTGTA